MISYDWSKEKVEKAVKNNTCYRDVLRELEIPARGRNTDTLKAKITEYNLDTSHFNFVSKTKGQKAYKDSSQYLHENSNIQSFRLKENGSPIIDKETFVSYAQTHKKSDVYRHFNITRNKYIALEYYFIKLNRN